MAKKQLRSKPVIKPVIKPSVKIDGAKNALETLFDSDEAPILKSVGYVKIDQGWVSYVMTTQGKEVLEITVEEPNLRQIAEETSKINFVETFMNQGIL